MYALKHDNLSANCLTRLSTPVDDRQSDKQGGVWKVLGGTGKRKGDRDTSR